MTLEERKHIVNLALEADAAENDAEVYCSCYGGGDGLFISVRDKRLGPTELGKVRMSVSLFECMGADSEEYRECEAYLKELLKKGEANERIEENPERQTAKAPAEEADQSSGA